jgi:phosphoribosyl 1,2-cyclic phosphodiesterase
MAADGTLTFWGVRRAIPAPGLHTVTCGGNTSCVSVAYRRHLIIFDAGSGLRQLGRALLAQEEPPITGSRFFTHTHWDPMQGLPFFAPAFAPETQCGISGEARRWSPLVELMEDQIQHPVFPVEMPDLFRAPSDFRGSASPPSDVPIRTPP